MGKGPKPEPGPSLSVFLHPMLREFSAFFTKQVANSIFALVIFLALLISPWVPIPRYDFMLLVCIGMQTWMVWSKLESIRELQLICIFHALGLGLELYKVNTGSWSYPEESWSKFAGVPFYSGFMYAAVASYILQAWRNFDLKFHRMPSPRRTWLTVGLIYANFFLSRFFGDWRWLVGAILVICFRASYVEFTCAKERFRMPVLLAFGLIGSFVWIAENICTYLGAWVYPHQEDGWAMVHPAKVVSWSMMVIVAFVSVWRWRARTEPLPVSANAIT